MRADQELLDDIMKRCNPSKLVCGEDAAKVIKKREEAAKEKQRIEEEKIIQEWEDKRQEFYAKSDKERYNDFLVIYNMVISEL